MSNPKPQTPNFHARKSKDSMYYSTITGTPKDDDNIDEPWRDGSWIIWPNSTLSALSSSDCNDTVEGICYKNLSIQECMKRCPADNCGFGTFTQFKNGETICSPILSILHPNLTPLYRLRNQSYYNLDPNIVSMSVFVNTELFPFPPNFANTIFYGDILSLKNVDNNLSLNTELPKMKGPGPCILDKDVDSVMTIQPAIRTANYIIHDKPITFGDEIILVVQGTSYVMQVNNAGGINPLVWKEALGTLEKVGTRFQIIPVDHKKKIGDLVTYSDVIALNYKGIGMVAVDENEKTEAIHGDPTSRILYLSTSPVLMSSQEYKKYSDEMKGSDAGGKYQDAQYTESPFSMKFKFTSLMNAYYCDEGKCKVVPPTEVEPAPFPQYSSWNKRPPSNVLSSGTYKGRPVFNHSGCWGMCPAVEDGAWHGKNVITLAGNQHIPADYLPETQPEPLWKQTHNKDMRILFVSIGIALTILMIIAGIIIYRKVRRPGRT